MATTWPFVSGCYAKIFLVERKYYQGIARKVGTQHEGHESEHLVQTWGHEWLLVAGSCDYDCFDYFAFFRCQGLEYKNTHIYRQLTYIRECLLIPVSINQILNNALPKKTSILNAQQNGKVQASVLLHVSESSLAQHSSQASAAKA